MDKRKLAEILKYVGLVIGCIAKFTSGSLFVFNAYQNAIKSTFNYTQTDVALLSSFLNLGLGTGFLPGMLYDRFGPTITSGAGLVVSGVAYFLLWSTTKSVWYYHTRPGLMAFYFYLAGFGSLFSYMAALNTNVINFPAKHRGKVVSLLNAFFTGSPSVFVTIYYHVFSDGDYNNIENQDYGSFMFFLAILFISTNLLCVICLRDVSNMDMSVTNSSVEANIHQTDENVNTSPEEDKGVTRKSYSIRFIILVKNPSFHLLAYSFTSAAILGLVVTNNITVVTKSIGLSSYDNALLIGMPITNTIISFFIGPISDKFKDKFPRLTFFVMACVFFTLTQLIYVFFGSLLVGIIASIILNGLGIGILWSLVPTIISEMFGVADFGRNWGLLLMLSGIGGLGGQAVFGVLYDSMIKNPGSLYCYGKSCFEYGFIVMTVIGIISIALSVILDIRQRHRDKYNQIL